MRRIKFAEVKRLALCKRGKNGMTTLFKSDGTFQLETLIKGDMEKGELLAVVYPKGIEHADDDGDFLDTTAAIKSITSSLIRNNGALDLEHDGKILTPEEAYTSEVFTIQKSDERFHNWKDYDGKSVDVTGGAAVQIQIDAPELRDSFRNGDWDGVSLFGPAAVEQVDVLAASKRVAARMGGVQEMNMTEAELQAILAKQNEAVATLVKSAVTEAVAALAPKAEGKEEGKTEDKTEKKEAPKFTGDANDPIALEAYGVELQTFELQTKIDSGDITAEEIISMSKSMSKSMSESGPSNDELNEAGIETNDDDNAEVKALQVQLFKARKGSNAPERSEAKDVVADLAKASEDEGLEISKILNESLGNSSGIANSMQVVRS